MSSCVDVCVCRAPVGPRIVMNVRTRNAHALRECECECMCYEGVSVNVCLSLFLCVAFAHGCSLRPARTCSPCHVSSRLCMSGVMCMAACCWGPRDHCLLPVSTRIHTHPPHPVGREGRPGVDGVMRCGCCCLLSFCCVASCLMPMFLLLLLHRWPGAALRDMLRRAGAGPDGSACSIRDFDVVDTLGHGDYGSVFEVGGSPWGGCTMR